MKVGGFSYLLRGTAHVFGDHISTDQILPGRYLELPDDEVGQYAMAGADPAFARKVQPGDFVVAGVNFGCGSSREGAVAALKRAGVAAVIARSFAPIFLRNCVCTGLIPVVVSSVEAIPDGATLEVDLRGRVVRVVSRPEQLSGRAAPQAPSGTDRPGLSRQPESYLELPILNLRGVAVEILQAGGILPYTRRRLGHEGP